MKKNLIALSLVGIMLLPSCVKDIESPSVTAVRDAKAAELQSIAELNNANAQAALTLANAEAALKVAEAKAKEAEAQKLAAETELIKVQAELEAVNVEIAKVKLEEEKVQLEIKKAELEAKLIQLENLKAQAELLQAQVAAELERLSVELEEALLRAKISLLEAQKAYNQAAADLDNDGLITLANTYFSACEALYEAQSQLAQDKVTLTRLENGLVDLQQAKAEQILANKRVIAQIKTYAEKLEGLRSTPIEDLMAMESEALSAMLDAYIVADERAEELGAAEEAWFEAWNTLPDYAIANPSFLAYQSGLDIYPSYEDNKLVYSFYHEDERIILYSPQYVEDEWIDVEGDIFDETTVIAGVADKDAFNLLAEDAVNAENERHENEIDYYESRIENYQNWLDRYSTALNSIESVLDEYRADVESANEEVAAAADEQESAGNAYYDYLYKEYAGAYMEQIRAYQTTEEQLNAAVNAYWDVQYQIWNLSSVEFYKDQIRFWEEQVAIQQNAVAAAEEGVSEADAAAVETAQAALDAQKAVVAAKQAAYDEAYAAMRAALLANLADPTTENQAAYDEALAASDAAEAALQTETNKLPDLEYALQAATEVYQSELQAVEDAQYWLEEYTNYLNDYSEQLEKRIALEEELEANELAMNEAQEAYDAAREQLPESEELSELESAMNDADYAFWDAFWKFSDASQKLQYEMEREIPGTGVSYSGLVQRVDNANRRIEDYENIIENENENYAANLESLAAWKEEIAAMFAEEAAYNAAVTELNDVLMAAWKDAFAANVVAENEAAEAEAQYDAIAAALDDEISLEEEIADCEAEIADLEAENADLSRIESQEILIERYKNRIAALETKVSILETKVAEAKEALDAASATE